MLTMRRGTHRVSVAALVLAYLCSLGQSLCLDYEREALLGFKAGLLDPGNRLRSWEGSECCQWEGVLCQNLTGHVVALDLHPNDNTSQHQSLGGAISPEVFQLRYLEYLDLSLNGFDGLRIPPEVGSLQRLTYLNLSDAGFSGTVPWQLGNLSELVSLDLSSSSDSFPLRIHSLSWISNLRGRLQHLYLDNVNLSSAGHDWGLHVSLLSRLVNLTMSDCSLSGAIPSSLQNLTALQILHLDGNPFYSELPDWFANMTSLVSLQLSNSHLQGSFPPRLSEHPHIQRVYLGGNALSGNITEILRGPWRSLRVFQAPGNELEGSIPSSVGNISSLEALDVKANLLEGSIPYSVGNLSAIRSLDLSYNQYLRGAIPSSLGRLFNLKSLVLSYNAFTGADALSTTQNLSNLQALDLSNNNLTLRIPSQWNPTFQLRVLRLASCHIQGLLPSFVLGHNSLEELNLSNNSFTGQIPDKLPNLPKLQKIDLSHNKLQGTLPASFYSSNHTVTYVNLRDNQLDGSLLHNYPTTGSNMSFPSALDLSINHFSGVIPEPICTLVGFSTFLSLSSNRLQGEIPPCICEHLEALDLSNNYLSGNLPLGLGHCSSLKVLNLANNHLEGQIPLELGNLIQLQVLHINDNRLRGEIPSSLRRCIQLEILDLSNNGVSGKFPEWIDHLPELRNLLARSNKLQGQIPTAVCDLQKLQILDLAMNSLSGSIPQCLSNISALRPAYTNTTSVLLYAQYYKEEEYLSIKGLTLAYKYILSAVTVIDLSQNNLSGKIPKEIGSLMGLHNLYLSQNNLNGNIPEELGEMLNLESLDLSHNRLSGRIPAALAQLNFLGYFDVSYNNLSGLIPFVNHLLTFDSASYLGNSGLCGRPLKKRCSFDQSPADCSGSMEEESCEGDDGSDQQWWKIGVGLGYGVGFGGVIAALALSRRLRTWYFEIIDEGITITVDRILQLYHRPKRPCFLLCH